MPEMKAPYYPIIYVRGYAMNRGAINETTADPFCGFNLGSTVFRAVPDRNRKPRKYMFESPVVRLASEFGYRDVCEDGYDVVDAEWEEDAEHQLTGNRLDSRSITIYRYYDVASTGWATAKRLKSKPLPKVCPSWCCGSATSCVKTRPMG